MATVNFQCGNCSNLMAVSAEHVGKQVRCPHCQAVVVAPAAAPAPAPAPGSFDATISFAPPQAADNEDIFAPPEPVDDLFGRPDAPRVELPASAPAPPAPTITMDGPPAAPEPFGSTMTFADAPAPVPAGNSALPSWMHAPPAPAAADAASAFVAPAPAAEAPPADHAEALPQLVRKPRDGGGWFIGLVFIPLVSYSILTTIAVAVLLYRMQEAAPPPPNPLENLPSFDPSDPDHMTHIKVAPKTLNRARNIDVAKATAPLPDYLIVPLGRKLRVGDLEVEPLRVSWEVVSVDVDGFDKPERCTYPSLVLHFKLRNVSDNTVFQPMSTYFDRKWNPKKGEPPPLTILELQGTGEPTRFFGGPAAYQAPPAGSSSDESLEHVHGNKYRQILEPGEEMEGFVCTDGDDKAAVEAIDDYHGKLLWRVHLRRGIAALDAHRLVPVSSVVGVVFTDDDYRKSS